MSPTEPLAICAHLEPHCNVLLASGASILARDTGWTECRLNLVFSSGPRVEEMQANWSLPDYLEPWTNRDPHYSPENGLFCALCKMGLSWPYIGP